MKARNELFEGPEDLKRREASKHRMLARFRLPPTAAEEARVSRETERARRRTFAIAGTIVVVVR